MLNESGMGITIPQPVKFSSLIPASLVEVWTAWTTEAGACTFFAPACSIDYRVGGAYEMYFDLDAPAGQRGGEGCRILAVEEYRLLSFTWNAPPELPAIRSQHTHVMVYFAKIMDNSTRLTLIHDGWGISEDWQKARAYFVRAWGKVVLPRLISRFTNGPIQWQ